MRKLGLSLLVICIISGLIAPFVVAFDYGCNYDWVRYLTVSFTDVDPPGYLDPASGTSPSGFWSQITQNDFLPAVCNCDDSNHYRNCASGIINAYVQDAQLWLRQINGCEWKDEGTGQWSPRRGHTNFPYLRSGTVVSANEPFRLQFGIYYDDWGNHGAGVVLRNSSGKILEVWGDTGATGCLAFRIQGETVLTYPVGTGYKNVSFTYDGSTYLLDVNGTQVSRSVWRHPAGSYLEVGNGVTQSGPNGGLDMWVSFHVSGFTFDYKDYAPSCGSFSLDTTITQGETVPIYVSGSDDRGIDLIGVYYRPSGGGSWTHIGDISCGGVGSTSCSGTVYWDTSGVAPGGSVRR